MGGRVEGVRLWRGPGIDSKKLAGAVGKRYHVPCIIDGLTKRRHVPLYTETQALYEKFMPVKFYSLPLQISTTVYACGFMTLNPLVASLLSL